MTKPQSPAQAGRSLPTVTELGRMLTTLSRQHNQFDVAHLQDDAKLSAAATRAMRVVEDQQWALRDLICTLPARSLSDCVVQLGVANLLASGLEGEPSNPREQDRRAASVERMTIGIAIVLAEVGKIDLKDLDMESFQTLHAWRFPAAGALSAG